MIPHLVVLTDRSQLPLGRGLVPTVAECASAGLRAVIVREHDLPGEARAGLVRELATIPDLMVLTSRAPDRSAHGIHLSADQPAPLDGFWGRSCHSRAGVRRAAAQGASWATLSPYATSRSKPGHGPALPRWAFAGLPVPVLALAGIDVHNAGAAVAAGAHGVAVMGAVMRAADPAAVVGGLLEAVS